MPSRLSLHFWVASFYMVFSTRIIYHKGFKGTRRILDLSSWLNLFILSQEKKNEVNVREGRNICFDRWIVNRLWKLRPRPHPPLRSRQSTVLCLPPIPPRRQRLRQRPNLRQLRNRQRKVRPSVLRMTFCPSFESRCINCHGGDRTEKGLVLKTYTDLMAGSENGPVVTPGDAADSTVGRTGHQPENAQARTQAHAASSPADRGLGQSGRAE